MEPKTVRELIKELKKMNPDALALFHFRAEIGDKILVGLAPFTKLQSLKVIKKKEDWYIQSKSSKAIEIVALTY